MERIHFLRKVSSVKFVLPPEIEVLSKRQNLLSLEPNSFFLGNTPSVISLLKRGQL